MPNMSSSIVLLLCKQFVIIAYFEAAKIEKKQTQQKNIANTLAQYLHKTQR